MLNTQKTSHISLSHSEGPISHPQGWAMVWLVSTWVKSRNCGCLVTWFCYQLIAKPGNNTASTPWPHPHVFWKSDWEMCCAYMVINFQIVHVIHCHFGCHWFGNVYVRKYNQEIQFIDTLFFFPIPSQENLMASKEAQDLEIDTSDIQNRTLSKAATKWVTNANSTSSYIECAEQIWQILCLDWYHVMENDDSEIHFSLTFDLQNIGVSLNSLRP